jgi:hypothetical protein
MRCNISSYKYSHNLCTEALVDNLYDVLIGVLHVFITGKVETILGDRLNNLRVYVQLYLWDHKLQLNILTQGSAFVSLVLDRFSV